MKEQAKKQFARINWGDAEELTPFDFDSIMLYPFKAFAADVFDVPTIVIGADAPDPQGAGVHPPKTPPTSA